MHMKLDANKTAGALAGAYVSEIAIWAAQYCWHVAVPDPVAAAFTGLLTLILIHIPIFGSTPTTAG